MNRIAPIRYGFLKIKSYSAVNYLEERGFHKSSKVIRNILVSLFIATINMKLCEDFDGHLVVIVHAKNGKMTIFFNSYL